MPSSGMEKYLFLQGPHGVTSQKAAFFMVTAMKTSNLTKYISIQILAAKK
jgi:hypothetical protein